MSRSFLNLAREPYVNSRPVVRLSIVLWLAGLLLFGGNLWLYWDFFAGRSGTDARLEQVGHEIDRTEQRITSLESQLAGFDLAEQNQRVEYLNTRIDRRHFSWSRLFDTLARILPDDIRLTRLTPSSLDDQARGRGTLRNADDAADDQRVALQIEAVARSNESILTMVDALFTDDAFEQPNLSRQALQDDGMIRFDIHTIYDPLAGSRGDEAQDEVEQGPAEGGESAPAEAPGAADGTPREARNRRPSRLSSPASSPPEVVR